jgi:hypothetical protein
MRWGFITNYEIPIGRSLQLGFEFVGSCGHIEPQDQAVLLHEWIARNGGLNLVAGQDVKGAAKFLRQLVLPLLDQASRRNNKAAIEVAADKKFRVIETRLSSFLG